MRAIEPARRLEALCSAFGWQGGTIHQAAGETGCEPSKLLYGEPVSGEGLTSSFAAGWFAVRTCSLEFNKDRNFPAHCGDVDFWLGVIDGAELRLRGVA